MSHLSQLLNGVTVSSMAKNQKLSENTIYNYIIQDVLDLNRKNGTNLSTKIRDIRNNPQPYRDLVNKSKPSNRPKQLHELVRFNNPLEAINNLEGDVRMGAIIMYNTLVNNA